MLVASPLTRQQQQERPPEGLLVAVASTSPSSFVENVVGRTRSSEHGFRRHSSEHEFTEHASTRHSAAPENRGVWKARVAFTLPKRRIAPWLEEKEYLDLGTGKNRSDDDDSDDYLDNINDEDFEHSIGGDDDYSGIGEDAFADSSSEDGNDDNMSTSSLPSNLQFRHGSRGSIPPPTVQTSPGATFPLPKSKLRPPTPTRTARNRSTQHFIPIRSTSPRPTSPKTTASRSFRARNESTPLGSTGGNGATSRISKIPRKSLPPFGNRRLNPTPPPQGNSAAVSDVTPSPLNVADHPALVHKKITEAMEAVSPSSSPTRLYGSDPGTYGRPLLGAAPRRRPPLSSLPKSGRALTLSPPLPTTRNSSSPRRPLPLPTNAVFAATAAAAAAAESSSPSSHPPPNSDRYDIPTTPEDETIPSQDQEEPGSMRRHAPVSTDTKTTTTSTTVSSSTIEPHSLALVVKTSISTDDPEDNKEKIGGAQTRSVDDNGDAIVMSPPRRRSSFAEGVRESEKFPIVQSNEGHVDTDDILSERDYDVNPTALYLTFENRQWGLCYQRIQSHPEEVRVWIVRRRGRRNSSIRNFYPFEELAENGSGNDGDVRASSSLLSSSTRSSSSSCSNASTTKATSEVPDFDEDVIDASRRRVDQKDQVSWRMLPLHASVLFAAPLQIVNALLDVFPDATRSVDAGGMLPLHLACRRRHQLRPVFPQLEQDGGDDAGADDYSKEDLEAVMDCLLAVYPEALYVRDGKGMLPQVPGGLETTALLLEPEEEQAQKANDSTPKRECVIKSPPISPTIRKKRSRPSPDRDRGGGGGSSETGDNDNFVETFGEPSTNPDLMALLATPMPPPFAPEMDSLEASPTKSTDFLSPLRPRELNASPKSANLTLPSLASLSTITSIEHNRHMRYACVHESLDSASTTGRKKQEETIIQEETQPEAPASVPAAVDKELYITRAEHETALRKQADTIRTHWTSELQRERLEVERTVRLEYEKRIERNRRDHEAQLQRLRIKHTEAVDGLCGEHAKEILAVKADGDRRVSDARLQAEREWAASRETLESETEDLRQELEASNAQAELLRAVMEGMRVQKETLVREVTALSKLLETARAASERKRQAEEKARVARVEMIRALADREETDGIELSRCEEDEMFAAGQKRLADILRRCPEVPPSPERTRSSGSEEGKVPEGDNDRCGGREGRQDSLKSNPQRSSIDPTQNNASTGGSCGRHSRASRPQVLDSPARNSNGSGSQHSGIRSGRGGSSPGSPQVSEGRNSTSQTRTSESITNLRILLNMSKGQETSQRRLLHQVVKDLLEEEEGEEEDEIRRFRMEQEVAELEFEVAKLDENPPQRGGAANEDLSANRPPPFEGIQITSLPSGAAGDAERGTASASDTVSGGGFANLEHMRDDMSALTEFTS